MSGESKFSLQELSELTGVDPRTIRWYIAEGLLRGPETRGPKAYYTEHHRKRLDVIRQLRDVYGLPISEIRRYVTMAGDEDIQLVPVHPKHGLAWREVPTGRIPKAMDPGLETSRWTPLAGEPDPRLAPEGDEGFGPVSRRALWSSTWAKERQASLGSPYPGLDKRMVGPQSPLVKLIELLAKAMGQRRVRGQARGSKWFEVEITRDILLRFRGDFDLRQMDQINRLADHLRAFLLGGGDASGEPTAKDEKKEGESAPP